MANSGQRDNLIRNTPAGAGSDDVEKQCPGKLFTKLGDLFVPKPEKRLNKWWNTIYVISCVLAVSLDPLFLYIPIIKEKNKCLGMDKTLRTVALLLWSITEFISIIHIIHEVIKARRDSSGWKWKSLFKSIIIDVLTILPIPQLAILVVFLVMGDSENLLPRICLNFILLLQYVPNVYRLHQGSKKLERKKLETSEKPIKDSVNWIKGAFNFFLYILASHVFGAFWYFFSIQRMISCRYQACNNTEGCIATRYCNDTPTTNITFLNDLCPISPSNATIFDFGIFLDALQSGTTDQSTSFPKKFFYSFWWGIRNLSNFGTNLETSTYVWENFFAILISVIGLLLFIYLIGNLQIYMQHDALKKLQEKDEDDKKTAKTQKILKKEKVIREFVSKIDLPDHLKAEIMEYIKEKDVVDKNMDADDVVVNLPFLFSVLSMDIKIRINNHFRMSALKKVQMLRDMDPKVLEKLCGCLSSEIIYHKDTDLRKPGDPIDSLLFITEGTVWTCEYPSMKTKSLDKGDCLGHELLSLVSPRISFSDHQNPKSTQTVKCRTNLKAFPLKYENLSRVVTECRALWNQSLYNCDIDSEELEELARLQGNTAPASETYMPLWEEHIRMQRKKIMKEKDTHKWLLTSAVSEDLRTEIKKNMKKNKLVKKHIDADVDVKFLFSILPWAIKSWLKKDVGMNALSKVRMLLEMPEPSSEFICKFLDKPVVYDKNSYIVQEGKPLTSILFIIKGVISDAPTPGSLVDTKLCLEKGYLFGEQLLSWASSSSSHDLPTSDQNVKCQTKVEAFALDAWKLKTAVSELGNKWTTYYIPPLMQNETHMQLENKPLEEIEDGEKKKMMIKEKDIREWVSTNGLPEDLKKEIMEHVKENNVVEKNMDADVDVKYLLSIDLPWTIERSIRHRLCMSTLKNVPFLNTMDEEVLNSICFYIEPVLYTQNAYVVQAGEPIESMLIIVGGVIICTDTTSDAGTTGSSLDRTKRLQKGDVFGDELLSWAFPIFDNPVPISMQVVKCETKVEAFALRAKDLRSVVADYSIEWVRNFDKHSNSQQLDELTPRHDKIDQILNETYNEKLETTNLEIEDEESRQKRKIMMKEKSVLEWLSRNGIPEGVKTIIMINIKVNGSVKKDLDADVDVKYLLSIGLPSAIKTSLTEHLCISTLMKVTMLENMDELVFAYICIYVEPVIYTKDSYIVQAGGSLDFMLIITEGEIVWTDTTSDTEQTGSLGKGDVYGEELLNRASIPNVFDSGPARVSTRNVKCQTKVEAFALTIEGLKKTVNSRRSSWDQNFQKGSNSQQVEELTVAHENNEIDTNNVQGKIMN